MSRLDIDFVRQQFPAFATPEIQGWAFFENAGGSFPCQQVIDRLLEYHLAPKVQPHHPYPASQLVGRMMDRGPSSMADLLGVELDEVMIGPSTTQNTSVLAHALRSLVSAGDAIVVTAQDHEANRGAWLRLAAEAELEVREWAVDPDTGRLDVDELDNLLDERVQLVAVPHVSNIIGEINPIRTICNRAHGVGAIAVVDGVASAPHGLPDVRALDADIYLFSTYKTYGPHQGVMVVRGDLLQRLPNQGHFFNADKIAKRLVPAGPDHAHVSAVAGIAEYVDLLNDHHFDDEVDAMAGASRVSDLWREHESELLAPLLDFLDEHDRVRLLGPATTALRVPTVAISVSGSPAAIAAELARDHRIMAAGGHFYAYRLMEAVGIDPAEGVLRFSFVHNTAAAEIRQLIDALEQVL